MFKLKSPWIGRFPRLHYIAVAAVLLVVVHFYYVTPTENQATPPNRGWNTNSSGDDICSMFTGLERLVITVKTGATEALDKIPTQLRTSLRCAPHVYVFSDMAQQIGSTQVYDALRKIPPEVKDGNSDFDIYRKQQELQDPVQIISDLKDFKDPRNENDLAAWTLDKYKNLHVVEEVWDLHPDMDWYLHIDADTYILWSSLIAWVQKLDPSSESFLGSLSYINDKPFGHGGSGILLSNGAMRNLVVDHNGTAAKWDSKIHDNCCGDWVLAQVLHEYGIELKNSWPTLNGEAPNTIPFASDHWCQPVVSLHHMSPSEADRVGKFEQNRQNKSTPVLYSEIFNDLIFDTIPDLLDDWDNMGTDETLTDIVSADACSEACTLNPDCFQSLFNGKECSLGTNSFKLGEKHEADDGVRWQSTWNRTRIAAWASAQKPCTQPIFPFQRRPWYWVWDG